MKTVIHLCVSLALISTAFAAGLARQDAVDVSIIRLLASPQEYSKKVVRIVGYLNIEFEGNAIYLHEEDFKHAIMSNSLWIRAKPEMMQELKKLSRQYVLIEGVFDPKDKGHMDMFGGGFEDINRADAWRFTRSGP